MRSCRHFLTLAATVVCCCGCTDNPFSGAFSPQESAAEVATEDVALSNDGESLAYEAADQRETSIADRVRKRLGDLFESVLPTLDQARELVDRHASLPDISRVPFTSDKQSNSAEINELLDEAIEILGISEVSDYRQRIRDSNAAISTSHANIADYRRQRVSASWAKDQSQLDKVNPFELSKEALDERIESEIAEIKTQKFLLVENPLPYLGFDFLWQCGT